jgi:hypothetical protein
MKQYKSNKNSKNMKENGNMKENNKKKMSGLKKVLVIVAASIGSLVVGLFLLGVIIVALVPDDYSAMADSNVKVEETTTGVEETEAETTVPEESEPETTEVETTALVETEPEEGETKEAMYEGAIKVIIGGEIYYKHPDYPDTLFYYNEDGYIEGSTAMSDDTDSEWVDDGSGDVGDTGEDGDAAYRITMVQNAWPDEFPGITYGEVFDAQYRGQWYGGYESDTDKSKYAVFCDGTYTAANGRGLNINIKFLVDDSGNCNMTSLTLAGKTQEDWKALAIMGDAFLNYSMAQQTNKLRNSLR